MEADLITEGTAILVDQRGHPLGGQVGTVVEAAGDRLVARLEGGRVVQLPAAACCPVDSCEEEE